MSRVLGGVRLPQGAKILDVGCGTGGNLVFLEKYGEVSGCDCAEEAIRYCRSRGCGDVRIADICELPYPDCSYDLVTCLDVLEHIPLDTVAFQELARVTKPHGFLLLTVPANPRLYSSFDCVSGHLRRYTVKEMRELGLKNGLRALRCSHYISLAHPLIRFYIRKGDLVRGNGRWIQDMETAYPASETALSILNRLEYVILRHFDLPWGSSLVSLFQKTGEVRKPKGDFS